MNDLSGIKMLNKAKAVKKSQDRARAMNRSGSGRLVEINPPKRKGAN